MVLLNIDGPTKAESEEQARATLKEQVTMACAEYEVKAFSFPRRSTPYSLFTKHSLYNHLPMGRDSISSWLNSVH
jgi:hypothetical protein